MLASSAWGPGFTPQSKTASYQRRYKNGTSSSLVWHSTLKREIPALSEESRIENPSKSEVIGCCGGDGKTEWPRRTDKSRTLKKKSILYRWWSILLFRSTPTKCWICHRYSFNNRFVCLHILFRRLFQITRWQLVALYLDVDCLIV